MRLEHATTDPTWFTTLQHLSASSISTFEDCPRRWAETYILGNRDPQNKYAAIGSAAHTLAEKVLTGAEIISSDWHPIKDPSEKSNLADYLVVVATTKEKTIGVELGHFVQMAEDMPPIVIYIDQLIEIDEVTLMIRDHKTNRKYESALEWKKKIQPRLYAWAIRKKYPNVQTIMFSIAYINQNCNLVEWEIPRSEDIVTEERVLSSWSKMVEYWNAYRLNSDIGVYSETMSPNCQYCTIKDKCRTFQSSVVQFNTPQFLETFKSLPERYLEIKTIADLASALLKDLEEQMKNQIEQHGSVIHKGLTFVLESGNSRRDIPFIPFWNSIVEEDSKVPGTLAKILARGEDVFSIKVTEIDKLIKMYPALQPIITPLVSKNPSKTKSIKISG